MIWQHGLGKRKARTSAAPFYMATCVLSPEDGPTNSKITTNANLSPIPDDHHHQNGTGDTPRLLAADQAAASDIAFNESKQNDNSHNQPNASTHVFLFRWKDWEAEKRFKQPLQQGITGGLGKLGRLEWKTGFEDLQEGWMKEGMRVERYPLSSGRLFSLR